MLQLVFITFAPLFQPSKKDISKDLLPLSVQSGAGGNNIRMGRVNKFINLPTAFLLHDVPSKSF